MKTFFTAAVLALAAASEFSVAQTNITIGPCAATEFNVYFEEWKADLTEDARDTIAIVQRDLQGCSIDRVRIVGLAGARGDAEVNLEVSMQRAEAIATALEAGGWSKDNFELAALGEAGATVDDVTRPMRRRAHVIVDASTPR